MSGQQHAPAALYPRDRPGTHCTGGWVGPRDDRKGGKSRPYRDSIPDRPARSSVAIPTELPGRTFEVHSINFICVQHKIKEATVCFLSQQDYSVT